MDNISILYEDDCLIVIDKPAGIVSNRAQTVKDITIQDWMDQKYRIDLSEDLEFRERSGLVHRLDKETAGVMVLGKTGDCMRELMRLFKNREVEKKYLALTHGYWKVMSGVIQLPIARDRKNRKKFAVREGGKSATTEYRVLDQKKTIEVPDYLGVDTRGYSGFSLVEFTPHSGRTHQIRVHARHEGHPIVGDYIYAGRKRSRNDRKWSRRVMLTASEIKFIHPELGTRISVSSGSSDLEEVINTYLR